MGVLFSFFSYQCRYGVLYVRTDYSVRALLFFPLSFFPIFLQCNAEWMAHLGIIDGRSVPNDITTNL